MIKEKKLFINDGFIKCAKCGDEEWSPKGEIFNGKFFCDSCLKKIIAGQNMSLKQ